MPTILTSWFTAFYDAAAAMDEKGVSSEGRVGVLNPRQYYKLIQEVGDSGLINRDEQGTARQRGQGIVEIAGIKIFKSMNIPFFSKYGTKYGTGSATNPGVTFLVTLALSCLLTSKMLLTMLPVFDNEYGEETEFANSCGLIFQREGAAACVEAIGPQVQVTSGDVSVIYQGDVILGRLAMGADYLNPAACVRTDCWRGYWFCWQRCLLIFF